MFTKEPLAHGELLPTHIIYVTLIRSTLELHQLSIVSYIIESDAGLLYGIELNFHDVTHMRT